MSDQPVETAPATDTPAKDDVVVEGDVKPGDVVDVVGPATEPPAEPAPTEPPVEGSAAAAAAGPEDVVPGSTEPAAIAGVDPAGATIPPDGAPPVEPAPEPAADEVEDVVVDVEVVEEGHPEPLPVNPGVLQDNVSKPGVEQTHTRDAHGEDASQHVTSSATGGPTPTEEDILAEHAANVAKGEADAQAATEAQAEPS